MQQPRKQVTRLLVELREGNEAALQELTPIIYQELEQLAHAFLRRESRNATIQTTDLVHEAYLRLIEESHFNWENRAHFFAVAARAMRQFLIYYAKRKRAQKRGGDEARVTLDEGAVLAESKTAELLALDEALDRLSAFDQRMCRIVELRYFTGLTIEETARALAISPATVKREWQTARAWLYQELNQN